MLFDIEAEVKEKLLQTQRINKMILLEKETLETSLKDKHSYSHQLLNIFNMSIESEQKEIEILQEKMSSLDVQLKERDEKITGKYTNH